MTATLTPAERAASKKSRAASSLKAPEIATPTLLLTLGCLSLWSANLAAAMLGLVPLWLTALLGGVASFICFTPMHDASHKSITRTSWPNELIGRLCAITLVGPFPAFRYLHLAHHRHTNEDHEDPDLWSGRGPWFLLPLRWLTQDLHYYAFYFMRIKERPIRESGEIVATLTTYGVIIAALFALGYGELAVAAWLIPGRIGLTLLAFSFDYLPHRPHAIPAKEDRFKATVVRPVWWMTPVLLYQNYHLIHHLYPGVPFYRYASVWRDRREELLAKGADVRGAFN